MLVEITRSGVMLHAPDDAPMGLVLVAAWMLLDPQETAFYLGPGRSVSVLSDSGHDGLVIRNLDELNTICKLLYEQDVSILRSDLFAEDREIVQGLLMSQISPDVGRCWHA